MRTIISNLKTARMVMMLILALLTTQTVLADPADKAALTTAISEAETYQSSILESNPKQAEVLTMILNACKTVQDDANAAQEDVDFATAFVNEGVKQCKIAVAQANYAAAISEVEEYLDSIKENHPAQAEKLNNIINNAKAIESSSVDVLEFFTLVMKEAIKQIQIEVAQADYAATISQTEEYRASLQEKHPEQAQKLATMIDNAKAIESSTSVDVLEFFTLVLKEGIKQMQLEVAQADFAASIGDAEAYLDSIQGKYPEQAQKLSNVIGNAKAIESTSLEVLDFFTQVMREAIKQFKMEIAHIDLAAAISDAEAYMADIQESKPSVANVIQLFIDAAKQVQTDESYTQADLEFATAFMTELVKQAKEEVATDVNAVKAVSRLAAKFHDLQGRRMAQPAQKGIYVNNGRKVAVK